MCKYGNTFLPKKITWSAKWELKIIDICKRNQIFFVLATKFHWVMLVYKKWSSNFFKFTFCEPDNLFKMDGICTSEKSSVDI